MLIKKKKVRFSSVDWHSSVLQKNRDNPVSSQTEHEFLTKVIISITCSLGIDSLALRLLAILLVASQPHSVTLAEICARKWAYFTSRFSNLYCQCRYLIVPFHRCNRQNPKCKWRSEVQNSRQIFFVSSFNRLPTRLEAQIKRIIIFVTGAIELITEVVLVR